MAVIRVERRVNSDYAHSQRMRSNTPPLSLSLFMNLHKDMVMLEMIVKVWSSDS